MNVTSQIAKQLRDVYFGGNWTASNLKEHVADVNWLQAITKVNSCNTIVTLVYHMNYYVNAARKVLQGGPLDAKDIYSFDHPLIQSQEDWLQFMNNIWAEVEDLARLIELMPESRLWEDFSDNKYGNYYRNLTGIIEHVHYHLGQIVLVKRMVLDSE
jgi:hypothetical protein